MLLSQALPNLPLPGSETLSLWQGKGCWEAGASQDKGERVFKCAQGELIHKTNICGALLRSRGGSGSNPASGTRSWFIRSWSPPGGRRGVGLEGGAGQRPAGSPATKSTSPQMSAPGLRPLAPVYLLTSFFKISRKSCPWKHNGQHFSAGVEGKQTLSFPCTCLEFLNVPQSPGAWQARS